MDSASRPSSRQPPAEVHVHVRRIVEPGGAGHAQLVADGELAHQSTPGAPLEGQNRNDHDCGGQGVVPHVDHHQQYGDDTSRAADQHDHRRRVLRKFPQQGASRDHGRSHVHNDGLIIVPNPRTSRRGPSSSAREDAGGPWRPPSRWVLIVWITPTRPLAPSINRFEVLVCDCRRHVDRTTAVVMMDALAPTRPRRGRAQAPAPDRPPTRRGLRQREHPPRVPPGRSAASTPGSTAGCSRT